MALVSATEMINKAHAGHYAICAFNINNLEWTKSILEACEAAYNYGARWVDELLEYLQGNIDYMISFFKERLPELKVINPQGLYLVWVDMRALGMDKDELEDFMLNKAYLWLDEGYIFGTGGDGFERFNVACPRSTLKRALEQLEKAIKERC